MYMRKPTISIIAALGERTRVIGRDNGLLWKIQGDLPRFKVLTMGHPIIMGRKTYESIGKALPGRTNIIITRNPDFSALGGETAKSFKDALEVARQAVGSDEIFVIGGGQIYSEGLPFVDRLYLTLVDSDEPGDTYFPEYANDFEVVKKEEGSPTGNPPFRFETLERKR